MARSVAVPHGAAVLVRDIMGELEVDDLDGALEVVKARRDVEIRGVAMVRLDVVRGDLNLRDGGEAEIRDVGGDVEIASFRQARTHWPYRRRPGGARCRGAVG